MNCGFLDPSTQKCRILGVYVPKPEKCFCPHYQTELLVCSNCGNIIISTPYHDEEQILCGNCIKLSGTCGLCSHGLHCAFMEDPSPLPQTIQKTIMQSGATFITQIRNPEREVITCHLCPCWNSETGCERVNATCRNYERK